MFRILTSSQDTYITNKIVNGSRSIDANVGLAGTLDLFKLYGETLYSGSYNSTELSRLLVKFDYSPLLTLTRSQLDPTGASFKVMLELRNIYGGQMTPSNYTLQLHPMAKEWDEGTGFDVITFADRDSCNWMTASVNPSVSAWVLSGASASGSIGDVCDYYVSGNIGVGSQSLCVTQAFPRGDENLLMDITSLVSASIWNNLPNHGFRITFWDSQETDQTTRFVKRFGGRNTNNPIYHPRIYVKYDGDVVQDDSNLAIFDEPNRFYVYNTPRGIFENFKSGSSVITGTNCLNLELIASKSERITVNSWSQSHSQSINFITTSMAYFSASFSASQVSFGSLAQTGSYFADVTLATFSTASLDAFVRDQNYEESFLMLWKSADNTYLYSSGGYVPFHKFTSTPASFDQRNYVVNITNLRQNYFDTEHSRLRVFIQDWEFDYSTKRLPAVAVSRTFKNMYWRLINAYTREEIIPFDEIGTKMSSDGNGMFFDFWFTDLDNGHVYEFEFKIVENSSVTVINDQGFRFKVINE